MFNAKLNHITNYLMFLTLSLFASICLYFFSVMLISRLQGDDPSPNIPWTTLHVGFVLLIIPFVGKRLFAKIVGVKEDVELPRSAGVFVGMLRGLLYGGTLLVLGGAAFFCFAPEKLMAGELTRLAWGILIITGVLGVFFPPLTVARRTRLWLLVTLVSQFVMISTMRQMLGLYPFKFEYVQENIALDKMPLLDKKIAEKLLPVGASSIKVWGECTRETHVKCKVAPKDLELFITANKYMITQKSDKISSFGDNKHVIFIYNGETNILEGVFRNEGLPKNVIRPEPEKKSAGEEPRHPETAEPSKK